jgi:hypothetical protein
MIKQSCRSAAAAASIHFFASAAQRVVLTRIGTFFGWLALGMARELFEKSIISVIAACCGSDAGSAAWQRCYAFFRQDGPVRCYNCTAQVKSYSTGVAWGCQYLLLCRHFKGVTVTCILRPHAFYYAFKQAVRQ